MLLLTYPSQKIVRQGGVEDFKKTPASLVPSFRVERFTVADDQILQAVCARLCKLLVLCGSNICRTEYSSLSGGLGMLGNEVSLKLVRKKLGVL